MLITNNENALRVQCSDVLLEEIGSLRETLERQLERCERLGKPGVGLAAPQIGIAKKMAIVRVNNVSFDLINAEIKNGYDPKMFTDEGCLSFPGRVENTTRFQEIHMINNIGEPNQFIATGLLAVICQHELDHLNSKLFFDHAIPKAPKLPKIGVNEKCVCGSGRKFKKCCARK